MAGNANSGRRPDVFKQIEEQRQAIVRTESEGLYLPNYSGVKPEALKTNPNPIGGSISIGDGITGSTANRLLWTDANNTLQNFTLFEPDTLVMRDTATTFATDFSSRLLYDASGLPVLDWTQGILMDSPDGITCANWIGRTLNGSDGGATLNWSDGKLFYASAGTSVDWFNSALLDSDIQTVHWGNCTLTDNLSGVNSVDWNGRTLFDTGDSQSLSWNDRELTGDWKVTETFSLNGYTVATLPSGTVGMLAYVTDGLLPTYRGIAAGGGALTVLVFFDGTNWRFH